jgi:surface antigen
MPRVSVVLLACALAGCASEAGVSPARDATGSLTPQSTPRATAAVAGAALTANLDERDRARAFAAEMQALEYGEPGVPTGWRGEAGRHGTIVPGAQYDRAGSRCRDFTHTIYIDGRPQAARSTACRNPDGTWTPVG